MVREIFRRKKGKDFYKDQLEYLEYDPNDFTVDNDGKDDIYARDDDEIAHYVATKKC